MIAIPALKRWATEKRQDARVPGGKEKRAGCPRPACKMQALQRAPSQLFHVIVVRI
jgi:hypothetical protein